MLDEVTKEAVNELLPPYSDFQFDLKTVGSFFSGERNEMYFDTILVEEIYLDEMNKRILGQPIRHCYNLTTYQAHCLQQHLQPAAEME